MGRDKALLAWPPVAEGAPAVNTFLGAMRTATVRLEPLYDPKGLRLRG